MFLFSLIWMLLVYFVRMLYILYGEYQWEIGGGVSDFLLLYIDVYIILLLEINKIKIILYLIKINKYMYFNMELVYLGYVYMILVYVYVYWIL